MSKKAFQIMSMVAALAMVFGSFTSAGAASSKIPSIFKSVSVSPLISPNITSPSDVPTNWTLDFQDNFDGSSVDLTKWTPNWLGSSTSITPPINTSELSCYAPANVAVANGSLVLTAKASTLGTTCKTRSGTAAYSSGMVQSNGKYNTAYGYFEARIWNPAGADHKSVWPAFWTDGQSWPNDGEIDILEAYGTDASSSYHYHYSGGGPGGNATVTGSATGWHTYAAYWEPGKVTWFYDGAQVWQYTTGIISAPHYIILNLGVIGTQVTVPSQMLVDYVRVWKVAAGTPVPVTSTLTATKVPTGIPASPTPTASLIPTTSPVPASPTPTASLIPTASRVPASPTPTASSMPASPTTVPVQPSMTPTASSVPVQPTSTFAQPSATPTASAVPVLPTSTPVQPTATAQQQSLPTSETKYDDKNANFVYSTDWRDVSLTQASGGSFKKTGEDGSTVTFKFTGQSFSIIYTSGSAYGKVNVYIDGKLIKTLDENEKTTGYQKRWDYPGQITLGKHTLKLVTVGNGGAKSSIDAVIVR